MAKVTVKLNRSAVRDLLRSSEVQAELERRARQIELAAGPGHRVESTVGKTRARAAVITDTYEAKHSEATSRTLTRAIDAGRS